MESTNPTLQNLWRTLRGAIETACMLFGLPRAIAQKLWFSRVEYRLACGFLRPLETLLRRLIFLEALAREPAPRPEIKRREPRGMDAAFGAAFDPDCPEAWPARFDLAAAMDRRRLTGQRGACRRGAGAPYTHINGYASTPIALRLEALIRGFNDPAPLIERLARLLKRRPRAAFAFLARPRPRADPRSCQGAVLQVTHLTRAAYATFRDSS